MNFTGAWRVRRRIFGQNARFTGQAIIDEDGRYHENGLLVQDGQCFEAFRDYIYEQCGDHLRILFPDRRTFLNLTFKDGRARGIHQCGPDFYEARFRLLGNGWVTTYKVTGPRKAYVIVSIMRR